MAELPRSTRIGNGPVSPASVERSLAGLVEGDLLADRYRVIRKIGAGGMGEVWEAHHVVLDERVAIKALVLDGRRDDDTRAERLMREAEFVARIHHPNVVEISDFGHTASGLPYFVMELLRGRPLQEILKAHGPLSWPRAAAIATGIAKGLGAAHAIGVIHRDLKPANVFVLDDPARAGGCKVIDFGIAKATAVDDRDRALTRTGLVFGTPAYMSPEQARGETLDARADIYGLGIILHEALTGRRLFIARTPAEILYRQLFESPLPPSAFAPDAAIPPAIDAIAMRCLMKAPAQRFQRMQDVVDALDAALRGDAVAMPPPEVLPVPPAALQARYGSTRTEPAPIAGMTVPALSPVVHVEPTPPRSRRVLRAVAWIGGGAALGLALVVGAAFGHRAWMRGEAGAPAAVGLEADAAMRPAEAYIDDLPRQPENAEPPPKFEPESEPAGPPAIVEPPAKASPRRPAKPPTSVDDG